MAQYGRPDSDVSAGFWAPSTGAYLYETINEVTPSDTDYNYTEASGNPDAFQCGLSNVIDPLASTGHKIRVRSKYDTGDVTWTAVCRLKEGATTICSFALTISSSWVTDLYTLATAEANAITDYPNLRIEIEVDAPSHPSAPNAYVSWAELEVPDAPVPALSVYDGSAWKTATGIWVFDGSTWRQATDVWVYDGSAWKKAN